MMSDIDKYISVLGSSEASRIRKIFIVLTSPGLHWLWLHRYVTWVNDRCSGYRAIKLVLKLAYHLCKYFLIPVSKSFIAETGQLGRSLFLSNRGGIILGARAIGDNCTIHHNVTIGLRIGQDNSVDLPVIGNNVWIGPDCVIFGKVKIGNGVTIEGGSVVAKSIPDLAVVSGNPGRIIARNFDNSALLSSSDTSLDNYLEERRK